MKRRQKTLVCFLYIILSSHLWAGGGTGGGDKGEKRPADESDQLPVLKQVKRTSLFCKALQEVRQSIKKGGEKVCHEIIELSLCLNCMRLEDEDTLDEMGDLGVIFSDLSIYSDSDEPSCDSPPPPYEELFPDVAIETVLMEARKRALELSGAGCFSLVAEDLERVLSQHPGHQGKNYHSALLYQVLRKLYIQRKQFEKALASLGSEFEHLPFNFIENHDPGAIKDYANMLQAMGRTEDAFAFLNRRVTSKSRPYIRRQAALWRAQAHEERGETGKAESAFIEAITVAHQDPEAYLALIHHYYTHGDHQLAQALTGVMNRVILPSRQWQKYSDDLKTYIHEHLPESLSDYRCSEKDVMTAIKLWIDKGRLEESSAYWLPLMKYLWGDGTWYMLFGDDRNILLKLLLDLAKELSMLPDQRLQYYKALYYHRASWIQNGFYERQLVESILYALTEIFQNPDQAFEMAQFIVDDERKREYSGSPLAYVEALATLVEGHISKNNAQQAVIVFIDLIKRFDWGSKPPLQNFMAQLAPLMNTQQATNSLKSMFDNFEWVHCAAPKMMNSLVSSFGEERTAKMVEMALQKGPQRGLEVNSWKLTGFLKNPNTDEARFDGLILKALLTHPKIESTWKSVRQDTAASKLSKLLSSINIHQHNVTGDGFCMWHALSYGLSQLGIDNISGFDLQSEFGQSTHSGNYAPAHWGTSEHLAQVAQNYSVHIIELLQTGTDQLSGTLYQPQVAGNPATVTPVFGASGVLSTLQDLHAQGTPPIILINNTTLNADGSLELNSSNHWSAGIWLSAPTSVPSFAPESFQFNVSGVLNIHEFPFIQVVPAFESTLTQ